MEESEENRVATTRSVCKSLLSEVRGGDVSHGLSIAEMLLSEGPDFDPELLIDIVEAVVELSKQAGASNAEDYLRDKWPILKKAHLRRLTSKAE